MATTDSDRDRKLELLSGASCKPPPQSITRLWCLDENPRTVDKRRRFGDKICLGSSAVLPEGLSA